MDYIKQNWIKLLIFILFLGTGIFLSNQSQVDKARFLYKGIKDKLELVYVLNWQAKNISLEKSDLAISEFIAHSGGGLQGMKYLNCLECLENSKQNGLNFIEMDFSWTTDGELVALHGWESEIEGLFSEEKGRRSLAQFKDFKMVAGLTQMSFDDVAVWLSQNSEAYLITDIKDENVAALEKIKSEHPEIINQLIPQIYFFEEYAPVVNLGYDNVVLSLYKADYHHNLVYDFAKKKNILAITLPSNQLDYPGSLVKRLNDLGVVVLTHTVDDREEWQNFKKMGVDGAYTNFLFPTISPSF